MPVVLAVPGGPIAALEGDLAQPGAESRGTENMLPVMREALRVRATIGEICGVLREEWGEHDRELARH